ncbi:unnamed protein product [Linum trigynum]|uniref:Uncharacterized protein n=1 Tax=Linum trigynum TaxID=586398 RepID=A0AAV2CM07_9ROSI
MPTKEELLEFDLATEVSRGPMKVKFEKLDQHKKVNARGTSRVVEQDWKKRKRKKWRIKCAGCTNELVNLEGKVGSQGGGDDGNLLFRFNHNYQY